MQAWLGAAVAIKDPTAAAFLRQNGSNLLMVGHREEAALGVLAACFVSLAAQLPPHGAADASSAQMPALRRKFYILDGMRADAPEVGFWNRLAAVAPQAVKIAGVRDAAEIDRPKSPPSLPPAQQEGHENAPPIYLFLYNLGRFRDLRKEDDFGFSSRRRQAGQPGQAVRRHPARRPAAGHPHARSGATPTATSRRMLDRQSLRDFEMRVLFQMNANDSSSLMDSPEASRLGVHRAIFYDEGQGRIEKFRPYGLPSDEWLAWVEEAVARAGGDRRAVALYRGLSRFSRCRQRHYTGTCGVYARQLYY